MYARLRRAAALRASFYPTGAAAGTAARRAARHTRARRICGASHVSHVDLVLRRYKTTRWHATLQYIHASGTAVRPPCGDDAIKPTCHLVTK